MPILDAGQFSQLMSVRIGLEPAAPAAARQATQAQLKAIEQSLVERKRTVLEHRPEQYLEEHYRFHFGICQICRQPIVQQVIESAWLRCGPALTLALPEYIPGVKRYEFHVEALTALRLGDDARAANAIRAEIGSAREDICALLEQTGKP